MVKALPVKRQLARMCAYKKQPFDSVLLDELLNPQVPHLPLPDWDRTPGRIEGRFRSHVLPSVRDWSEQFLDGYINIDPSDIEQGYIWIDFSWMDQRFHIWGTVEMYRVTSADRVNWVL